MNEVTIAFSESDAADILEYWKKYEKYSYKTNGHFGPTLTHFIRIAVEEYVSNHMKEDILNV